MKSVSSLTATSLGGISEDLLDKAIKFNEETNLINIATDDIDFAGVQVNYTIMVDEKTVDAIAKVQDFKAVI